MIYLITFIILYIIFVFLLGGRSNIRNQYLSVPNAFQAWLVTLLVHLPFCVRSSRRIWTLISPDPYSGIFPVKLWNHFAEVTGVQPAQRDFTVLAHFKCVYLCQLGTSKYFYAEVEGNDPPWVLPQPMFSKHAQCLSVKLPNILKQKTLKHKVRGFHKYLLIITNTIEPHSIYLSDLMNLTMYL